MNKDPKVVVAIAVVAVLIIAGIAVAVVAINNNNNNSTKHTNVEDMTFDEMVDAAKGTTVNLGFYADTYCVQWLEDVFIPLAKEKYDITVTYKASGNFADVVKAYQAGTDSPYDAVWGRASGMASWLDVDGKGTSLLLKSNYQDKMPNVYNYSDLRADNTWKITYESVYGDGTYSKDVCSVTPFSGSVTNYVYNSAFNDSDVDWNKVLFTDKTDKTAIKTATVTVALTGDVLDTGTAVKDIDTTKTYTIESVRAYRNANVVGSSTISGVYGLPDNFTELASWLTLYPGQFYIPSATSGYVNFHTQLILEAMVFELASKDNGASWTACTDENADVWKTGGALAGKFVKGEDAKNKATYISYMETKIGTVNSAKDYEEAAPYLAKYIDSLQPYLNKTYTGWTNYNTGPNQHLVGNNGETDFSEGTIMLALSTTETLALRSAAYNCTIQSYMMDSACANRCGMFIPSTAKNPAGAIVICNLFNDPLMQAQYYNISGNGYNVDLDKIPAETRLVFEGYFAQYRAQGAAWIEPDVVEANSIPASIGCKETDLGNYINSHIKSTR